jgi:RHS repeat-associated protein
VQAWANNSSNNNPDLHAGNSPVLLNAGIAITPNTNNTNPTPTAYLRYIFYNTSGVPIGFGTSAITGASTSCNNLSVNYTAPEAGTLQVYVANESNTDVWFDEVNITVTQQLIAQENHYDPWGLNLVGIEKNGNPNHRYQYNGKEKVEEFNLNWNDYGARQYDPQLGRWHAIDALSEKHYPLSPYAYAGDNPVIFVDYDGKDYGVHINHNDRTIEIRATFITRTRDATSAQNAINHWNNASGQNVYVTGIDNNQRGVRKYINAIRYDINYNLRVEIDDSNPNPPNAPNGTPYDSNGEVRSVNDFTNEINSYNVLPDNHLKFQGSNPQGTVEAGNSNGNDVSVKESKRISPTGGHEVGHNLGNSHDNAGIMAAVNAGNSINASHSSETLAGVGIGNGSVGATASGDGRINSVQGTAPTNFNVGKTMSLNQYNRIQRRLERVLERDRVRQERRNYTYYEKNSFYCFIIIFKYCFLSTNKQCSV